MDRPPRDRVFAVAGDDKSAFAVEGERARIVGHDQRRAAGAGDAFDAVAQRDRERLPGLLDVALAFLEGA